MPICQNVFIILTKCLVDLPIRRLTEAKCAIDQWLKNCPLCAYVTEGDIFSSL